MEASVPPPPSSCCRRHNSRDIYTFPEHRNTDTLPCRFRHTDGRSHYGTAANIGPQGVHMHFHRPTKSHMLGGVLVDPELITSPGERGCGGGVLAVGSRVVAARG